MPAPPASKKAKRNEKSVLQEDSVLCEDDELDSPFTLYFVKLPDGNPTKLELQNLEDTFNIVNDGGLMPEWIDSESVDRLQVSDDFFVLPCFRGKLFRRLQARKIKVFGPPLVLECLNEQKKLPTWNHPAYCSTFEGAIISFTSLDPESKRELTEKISWMCGVVGELHHETTHLICGKSELTEKYKVAVNNSIKLMKKEWVEDLWKSSQTTLGKFSALIKDAINTYELRVFENLEMAVTSIDGTDRTNLIQLVEEHGGKIPGNMSKSKCSYLITDKTTGQKYTKALEWTSVKIVQTRWIRKCIDFGHLIDERKYHPKYISAEHIRSSTPKKDVKVTESGPDISSIAGPGGRLCASSFNSSSINTQVEHSYHHQSSFVSIASTSNIASTTITSNNMTIGRVRREESKIDKQSTPLARENIGPLIRYPTSQMISTQEVSDGYRDPIDQLRGQIDENHSDLFENCLFYICGVDDVRMEKWRRFLNLTGATRVPKPDSATNIVVVFPNKQERILIRKFLQQKDISIVNVQWVLECVKRRCIIPAEGFEWNENEDLLSHTSNSFVRYPSGMSQCTSGNDMSSCAEQTRSDIFANHTYYVHTSLGRRVARLSDRIRNHGGIVVHNPEKAEFVVFGHSAFIYELIPFDTVITDLYIDTCSELANLLPLSHHALFVPLPRPPVPIFQNYRFVLRSLNAYLRDYLTDMIQSNEGLIGDKMDSKSYLIMMDAGSLPEKPELKSRTVDFSWIISSMSQCRLQPIEDHLYKENATPLANFCRDDDVWTKCARERDSTEEIEVEVEERHKVPDQPVDTGNGGRGNISSPYENPYFPDLRQPYKMNLNLEGVSEYINNMESPARDTEDSLTTSRVGSILRKAVAITGRTERTENEASTCDILRSRLALAENRRTVSSTPVLVRDVDRSTRYMPMDESFADQNQEHEELNRHYALHPHFLLSISNMDQEDVADLQESIIQLGGRIEKEFNRDVTHLITSNMQRTPKVLCSIAAGKWCLAPDYVIKSSSAGRWLDEAPFEWCLNKLSDVSFERSSPKNRETRKILENLVSVCGLWRIRVAEMPITASVRMESRHNGAFSDWRCVIHQEDKKTQQISSILEAGGAIVHSITDYIEISTLKPNKVFASKDFKWNPQSARMLKTDRIPIYIYEVIYEYLVDRDDLEFSKFFHPIYQKA